MSVELALAALGTADLVLKYGKILVDACSSFRHAESELQDRILCVEVSWARTHQQIKFLDRIWNTLDEELKSLQERILLNLLTKLQGAIMQIQRVLKKRKANNEPPNEANGQMKKFKYVWIKESIDDAIKQLENWQKSFEPTWYLVMKIADPTIDEELARHRKDDNTGRESNSMSIARNVRDSLRPEGAVRNSIFLPEDGLASAQRRGIPYCTATILQRANGKQHILDSVTCLPEVNAKVLDKDVRDLARRLSGTDPIAFGLLQCRGVVRIFKGSRKVFSYDFIFSIPSGLRNPQSLRSILITAGPNTSLSTRFRIAQQLAQSVSYIHTYGFVHKSVRPETTLVFENDESKLSSSFLLGFEKFRPADGHTIRKGDNAWEKELYRHPRRQGLKPEDEYVMQQVRDPGYKSSMFEADIYSLGVCMLEIGLWQSFVSYDTDGNAAAPSQLLASVERHGNDPIAGPIKLKDALVALAKKELPERMGDRYTAIVVTCLTCLDLSNLDFSDEQEFQDEDDILVGVRYIEKVLLQLNGISV